MPYLSKAPLSFAIQTPVAIGPIDEYAMVILVWASAVCESEKTNVNTAGKLQIRHFNNGLILSRSRFVIDQPKFPRPPPRISTPAVLSMYLANWYLFSRGSGTRFSLPGRSRSRGSICAEIKCGPAFENEVWIFSRNVGTDRNSVV